MTWSWVGQHWGEIGTLTWDNAFLGIIPALIGLAISIPLGIVCARWRWIYPPVLSVTSILYALPSLALFAALIPYYGISDPTIIIPLTMFSLCVLVPNVVDGLRAVPAPVRQAAVAMGFGTFRRLIQVELPIAAPIVIAGLRVAVVSSISLVSLGQLVGITSLGYFFIDGLQRDFTTEIWVGLAGVILLALAADLVLVVLRWLITPWQRSGRGRRSQAASQPEPAEDDVRLVSGGAR
jgi:osmoprotectant transport system permease protein